MYLFHGLCDCDFKKNLKKILLIIKIYIYIIKIIGRLVFACKINKN
jgi:hypothetical protein